MLRARVSRASSFMIETSTYETMNRNCKRLRIVSAERIRRFLNCWRLKNHQSACVFFMTQVCLICFARVKSLHGVEEILADIKYVGFTFKLWIYLKKR